MNFVPIFFCVFVWLGQIPSSLSKVRYHRHRESYPVGYMGRGYLNMISFLNYTVQILENDGVIKEVHPSENKDGNILHNDLLMAVKQTDNGAQDNPQHVFAQAFLKAVDGYELFDTALANTRSSTSVTYSASVQRKKVDKYPTLEELIEEHRNMTKGQSDAEIITDEEQSFYKEVYGIVKAIHSKSFQKDTTSKRTLANEQSNEYQSWFLLLLGQSQRIGLNVFHMYDDSLAQYQGILNPKIHTITFWVMKPRKLEEVLSKINKTVNAKNKKEVVCVNQVTAYKE